MSNLFVPSSGRMPSCRWGERVGGGSASHAGWGGDVGVAGGRQGLSASQVADLPGQLSVEPPTTQPCYPPEAELGCRSGTARR